MHIKTARQEFKGILDDAVLEQDENINIARENARSSPDDEIKPFKSAAMKTLIRSVSELISLVEGTEAG